MLLQKAREHAEQRWRKHERFHKNQENAIMVKVKLKALEVIDSLLNFEEDLRLEVWTVWCGCKASHLSQHFIADFKAIEEGHGHANIPHANILQKLADLPKVPEKLVKAYREEIHTYLEHLIDRSNWVLAGEKLDKLGQDDKNRQLVMVCSKCQYDVAHYLFIRLCWISPTITTAI